jgi:hypothetical protein
MTGIVTAFKALSLEAQLQAYPEITAVLNSEGRAPSPARSGDPRPGMRQINATGKIPIYRNPKSVV